MPVALTVSQARQMALVQSGQPVPAAVQANLLIDTGATCTAIDNGLIAALGLSPTGSTPVHTPSTGGAPVVQQLYDVGIVVHGSGGMIPVHIFSNLPVLGADFAAQGISGLLGRDILRQARMTYGGPDGMVFLSF